MRTTIDSYLGLSPQYLGLRLSTTLLALLKLCSRYGPEPADVLFSAASALSDLSAPTASVPPAACTALAFTMPRAGFGTMNGTAGFGVCERSTTVLLSGALTVRPLIRNDGLPLRLATRCRENTTSEEVSGVPSEKTTSDRSLKVNVFASGEAV